MGDVGGVWRGDGVGLGVAVGMGMGSKECLNLGLSANPANRFNLHSLSGETLQAPIGTSMTILVWC